MKDFLKYVAATVVGIIAFLIVMGVFGMMSIIGMVASSEATKSVADNSVLVLNLSGTINEQGEEDIIGQLTGKNPDNIGMNDILSAIKKAKEEPKIKGIYIEANGISTGYATLQEIRNALEDFKSRANGLWLMLTAMHKATTMWLLLPTKYG